MSETLNTTIGPSSAKESNSDSEGPCKKCSNPCKDRMDCKRLSNCVTSARRLSIDFDEPITKGELEVRVESAIIEESKALAEGSIWSRSSWNCFARSG